MALYSGVNPIAANLPTNYEYYTGDGIAQGLNTNQSYFTLNDKLIGIYSGAMHYFRVPRPYWRDRLKKIRAAGLNAVETYVPWNLHEPESGVYDFGNGGSEFEDFLHLEEFLNTAKEEDLFVIVRPGPYICSEYNFGGFPSWLLREKVMGFRTSESTYMKYVARYFNVLLTLLATFQFTTGGPIIAFQVENEYGNLEYGDKFQPDKLYMEQLRDIFLQNGIVELLVTSDSPLWHGTKGTLPGVLFQTANFGDDADNQLNKLEEFQPGKPLMVMEYWIGWYDTWGNNHAGKSDADTRRVLENILNKNSSFSAYMFHGGTNFAFNSGAFFDNLLLDNSGYTAITTSYDYDSPLNENGAKRNKYYIVKELLETYNPVKTYVPEPPEDIPPVIYNSTKIQKALPLKSLLNYNSPTPINSKVLLPMELLDINNNNGQSNGYIIYRKDKVNLTEYSVLLIEGHVYDTVVVVVNGKLIAPKRLDSRSDLDSFGFWRLKDSTVTLNDEALEEATVDLVVENMGRVNGAAYDQYNQTFKGLWKGDVRINNDIVNDWTILPLELKKQWLNNLQGWEDFTAALYGPTMYNTILTIPDEPRDTYINTRGWGKGVVFVNGFALGRYAAIGPQYTLYLPAPFLIKGDNQINFFEHFYAPENGQVIYTDQQIFENPS